MEKTVQTSPSAKEIARVPAFGVTPPPRCYSIETRGVPAKCGSLATRIRRGNKWFASSFHCDYHADETDLPISGEYVIRRVRVTCEIYLAGVDDRPGDAQAEAVTRLESYLQLAGGVMDVRLVSSQIGRYPAKGGVPDVRTALGSRE